MTVSIENLSYNATMDQEALQAIAGSGFLGSVWSGIKKGVRRAWGYVRENPMVVFRVIQWGVKKLF